MVERKGPLPTPKSHATVCLLVRRDEIVLGVKKRKFGQGYIMGAGGKVDGDESSEECAKREIREELGVIVNDLKKAGTIDFHYPSSIGLESQRVDFYVAEFEGEPTETEEMKPVCFSRREIPYDRMLPSNSMFVPMMLRGGMVSGQIIFDHDMEWDARLKYEHKILTLK